jgi:hypothetical protein
VSLKITDTEMTSDLSPHFATVLVAPGRWLVSWLPVRILSRNEAVTAMTLAETIGAHEDMGPTHRLWPFVTSWAGELGLSPERVVELVSEPPDACEGEE